MFLGAGFIFAAPPAPLTVPPAHEEGSLLPGHREKSQDYLKSCFTLMLFSASFFMTLDTDISKSSCVTCWRLSRKANIPASVHTAFDSAPLAALICCAILRRSMPR